jgi:hypothetical protein
MPDIGDGAEASLQDGSGSIPVHACFGSGSATLLELTAHTCKIHSARERRVGI